ncbi:LAMI_0E06832g1_1 [Lachancea mirantina]|uniref:LAMI_0E06832g1_1 n=1 Tax=Lachancea mirantina TaxID=1230905 RepID=A0A1G4JMP9_9SACH|nr:LAMI_0E06832g1_1 [Lachancea mirantina]
MSPEDIVQKSTQLLDPLSGKSVQEVVEFYSVFDPISSKDLKEPLDFENEFFQEHCEFVELKNGAKVRVCRNLHQGEQPGRIWLFFHGLGGNITQFEPILRVLDALDEHFLAIDLPGFGESSEWAEYPMLEVVKCVDSVVGDVNKLVLVGHSMGCHLALHYQHLFREHRKIERIIFLTPASAVLPLLRRRAVRGALLVMFYMPFLFDYYRENFDQNKGLKSSGIVKFFYEGHPYRKLWQFSRNVKINSRSIIGYFRGWEPITWDTLTLDFDCVVVGADHDPITPLDGVKEFYNRLTTAHSAELVVLGDCSHNVCLDQPVKVAELFLRLASQ